MLDVNLGIESIKGLYATAEQFSVPLESIGMTKEGLVVPTKPLIYLGISGYVPQFVDPTTPDNANLFNCVDEPWQKLSAGISHLTNPNTSSRRLTSDIAASAGDVFTAGLNIMGKIPGVAIVLPPYVGFNPDGTAAKNLPVDGLSFRYNLWRPGPVEVNRFTNDAGQRIESVDFTLFISAPKEGSRMRQFPVTSHTILSGFHNQ